MRPTWLRRLPAWTRHAAISLPTPLSPVISTFASDRPARAISLLSLSATALEPRRTGVSVVSTVEFGIDLVGSVAVTNRRNPGATSVAMVPQPLTRVFNGPYD